MHDNVPVLILNFMCDFRVFRASKHKKERPDGVHLNAEGNKVFLFFLDSILQKVGVR